jgi:tetratricopeptide (TPR) repeat protein
MVLAGDYKKALSKLDYIIDTIAKKYAHQLWIIRGVINEILGYGQQAKKDFKRAYKYDRENTTKLLEKHEDIYLNVFPQQQRLCNFFQFIKVDFKGYKGAGGASIYLKPSFSFPFIKPPNMIPCVDQKVVLE